MVGGRSSPLLSASEQAEARLQERREAQQLAHRNPTLAREMGVGRPDVGGFSLVEDLGEALDLPGDAVEALRGRVVFLPR